MKFVALVSGGKDSIYSIMQCCNLGHELLGCVHLGAPPPEEGGDDEESYMYQSAASEALQTLVEECLQVPLIFYPRNGKSINTSLVYQEAIVGDEVEDLYQALLLAQNQFHDQIQAVSSGAILSTYQRIRIEHVCQRLNLTSLGYLWRMAPQHALLDKMIHDGITAVLVRAACPPGLRPRKHLNKSLAELQSHFLVLNSKYQFHVCGEGGEYESLVLDCPLYKRRLVLDEVEIVELEGDEGVGVLKIIKCHAETKKSEEEKETLATSSLQDNNKNTAQSTTTSTTSPPTAQQSQPLVTPPAIPTTTISQSIPQLLQYSLPRIKVLNGGLWHVSEIMVPIVPTPTSSSSSAAATSSSEADLAVQEAITVLDILRKILHTRNCTPQDVVFVHLYLSEISHFAKINKHYKNFFGTLLPPSRSCVGVGCNVLAGNRRVLLDCIIQCGSGNYMRGIRTTTTTTKQLQQQVGEGQGGDSYSYADAALDNSGCFPLRQVLHVESRSYWAPVTVGPYSQCNSLRGALHLLAGQIGLIPETMTLRRTWQEQLDQCWTNVASVLDALDGSASLHQNLFGCVVYVADHVYFTRQQEEEEDPASVMDQIERISWRQIGCNGGIVPGKVDSPIAADNDDDDDSRNSSDSQSDNDNDLQEANNNKSCPPPLLVVSIPEMPVGAIVEVEVIAMTQKAKSCLEITDLDEKATTRQILSSTEDDEGGWDTGHDFVVTPSPTTPPPVPRVDVHVQIRTLGDACASIATVTAHMHMPSRKSSSFANDPGVTSLDPTSILDDMIDTLQNALNNKEEDNPSSLLRWKNALHVRLYYISSSMMMTTDDDDDGNKRGLNKIVLDDGIALRAALQTSLASHSRREAGGQKSKTTTSQPPPASSVIPVQAIHLIHPQQMDDANKNSSSNSKSTAAAAPSATNAAATTTSDGDVGGGGGGDTVIVLALQAMFLDPIQLETELWIHHGRS